MKKFTFLSAILLCMACMAYGQWTYTSLTEPKSDMGSVSLGTKVYFAGGYNGFNCTYLVESYDVETGEWGTPGNLSVARQWPTCVACGTKIFFAGGLDFEAGDVFNTVDILDTETGQWTVEQLSLPRFDLAAVSYGSKVFFAGGFQFPYNTFSLVDIYDVETEEWSTDNLSQNRGGIARAVVGDVAIFAGGSVNSYTTSDRVDIYNFTSNTWTTATLSQARMYASATTVGDKVLIAGGCIAMNEPSNLVDIYNASENSWTTSNLSFPRSWLGNAATVNGKAYFAGGGIFSYGFSSPSNIIDIYDESTDTWSLDYLFEPLVSHSVVSSGDYLVIAGGINEANAKTSLVEIFYDPQTGINQLTEGILVINVYPNPAKDKITIDFEGNPAITDGMVTLFGSAGQELISEKWFPSKSELDISSLAPGLYFIKVENNQSISFKKFIKN
jgi:hypothetical protein